MDPIPSNRIDVAFNAAPPVVRKYIEDGKLADKVVDIADTYNLHVDAMGSLAELSRNMLIGVASPAEVVGELVLAGIDAETARKILADLNQQVFVPLQERIRNPQPETDEEEDMAPPTVVVSAPVPPTPPSPAAPVPAPVPQPPMLVVVPPSPPPAPPVSTPAPVVPQEHPQMRTMATDMQAAKEHRPVAPLFSPPPAPPAPPPVRVAPPPAPPPMAIAREVPPPPPNLPGAPVVHEYSVDPYREPVE